MLPRAVSQALALRSFRLALRSARLALRSSRLALRSSRLVLALARASRLLTLRTAPATRCTIRASSRAYFAV
jgi:hypothetical protein